MVDLGSIVCKRRLTDCGFPNKSVLLCMDMYGQWICAIIHGSCFHTRSRNICSLRMPTRMERSAKTRWRQPWRRWIPRSLQRLSQSFSDGMIGMGSQMEWRETSKTILTMTRPIIMIRRNVTVETVGKTDVWRPSTPSRLFDVRLGGLCWWWGWFLFDMFCF